MNNMAWYRRSERLIFDSFRSYDTAKIASIARNPIQASISRTGFHNSSFGPSSRNVKFSEISRSIFLPWKTHLKSHVLKGFKRFFSFSSTPGFSRPRISEISQSILRNMASQNSLKQSKWHGPFLGEAQRYYSSFRPGPTMPVTGAIFQSISKNSSFLNGIKEGQRISPFIGGTKRFYYVDRRQIHHFKPRGYKQWLQNPRNLLIVILVGGGVVVTIYFGNLETVPYTKRTHFVLLSRNMEKELGERQFKQMKGQFKGHMLPPLHPESIRVQRISQDIIEALQKGLSKENVWSDIRYSPESIGLPQEAHGAVKALTDAIEEEKWQTDENWRKEDEILDDRWVQKSRKIGQEKGMKSQTAHLEGLKWEVIVVDEPVVNAFCLPGGKIVVFTGLLKHFKTDAELATIIGHEVGHAVARHTAEQLSKNLWLTILQLILYQFFMPDIVNTMSNLLLRLPFSRRMEMEADYIGLLLIASAGYDPRVAPQVYEKLGNIVGDSKLQDYLATHPSGKKRAELLAQAQVMEEAFNIYREVQSGRGVEGFL